MVINLKVVERPSLNSFTLCQDIDKSLLKELKTVRVRSTTISKTRVSTSMQVGGARVNLNLPETGYKTAEISDYSYFTGNRTTHYYFKLLKSQGFEVYKEYVKKVVGIAIKDYLCVDLDELTIILENPHWNG